MGKLCELFLGNPFKGAFVAFLDFTGELRRFKKVHEFDFVHAVADERDDAAVLEIG